MIPPCASTTPPRMLTDPPETAAKADIRRPTAVTGAAHKYLTARIRLRPAEWLSLPLVYPCRSSNASMAKRASKKDRLPDPNTLAFTIVQAVTGEPPPEPA